MVWEFAFVLLKLLSGFVKSILSILYSNNIDFSLLKNVNFINIFFFALLMYFDASTCESKTETISS